MSAEVATFGAGCFWGVEAAFSRIDGLLSTAVGYMGGHAENPTYEDVCNDRTGHAEVVQAEFDPTRATYEQLLDVFWNSHDPTQLDRQGPDVGSQYRSVIFFHSPQQEAAAEESKKSLRQSGRFDRDLATVIVAASTFFKAEDYHQQYLAKRGIDSCSIDGPG